MIWKVKGFVQTLVVHVIAGTQLPRSISLSLRWRLSVQHRSGVTRGSTLNGYDTWQDIEAKYNKLQRLGAIRIIWSHISKPYSQPDSKELIKKIKDKQSMSHFALKPFQVPKNKHLLTSVKLKNRETPPTIWKPRSIISSIWASHVGQHCSLTFKAKLVQLVEHWK